MKASSIWCLVGAVLLIALAIPGAEALSPQETCQIVMNGTFIGDPDDCQGWYYCLNGQAIGGKCGTGYLYNSYTGSCDFPNNVVCSQTTSNMCQGLDAQFVRDPNNCQGYCYCSGGVANCTTCPSGQYFDLSGPACTWSQGNCVNGSPCLLAQNGFVKDPDSCSGWYRCVNGQIVNSGDCTDMYYNAFTGMCDYPANVGCNVVTTTSTVASTALPISNCTSEAGSKGFVKDYNSCNGYYYCVKEGQEGAEVYTSGHYGVCPFGSQFDQTSQNCTNSYNVNPICEANRCAGVSSTYMTANAECSAYIVCKDGKQVAGPTDCPTSYKYFNEKAQACQASKEGLPPVCSAAE